MLKFQKMFKKLNQEHLNFVEIYNVLALKIHLVNLMVDHSNSLIMKGKIFLIMILTVHQIYLFHVRHHNHIIFKNQKNAYNLNLLTTILFKMMHIIIKFIVQNLNHIILILKDHINVYNNVHKKHIDLMINLIITVLLNVATI